MLLVALLLAACADPASEQESGGTDSATDSATDTSIELDGGELYTANCADCHGADGTGTREGPDLTRELPRLSDDQIVEIILNGKGYDEMPPIEVSEAEARAIVAWMRAGF